MPFVNSVRGSYGAQGRFGKKILVAEQIPLSWSTWGSGVTVSTTGTNLYSVYNTSGSNTVWNKGAYSTTTFKAPFTMTMKKNATPTDTGIAYAMCGILPNSFVDSLIADPSEQYWWGYNHYPVSTNGSSNFYEKDANTGENTNGRVNGTIVPQGSWGSGDTWLITVETNGTLKYWRFGTVYRTVSVPTGIDWSAHVTNYSANSTYGGFYDIAVIKNGIWNGTTYVPAE